MGIHPVGLFHEELRFRGDLNNERLLSFLDKIIAFIWTYSITNPGVNALRTPLFAEMVNIHNGNPVEFAEHRFREEEVRNQMRNFHFTNPRPMTRSMLAWWAFSRPGQGFVSTRVKFDIEHIFPRSRQEKEGSAEDSSIEMLGNKSLLEAGINMRASDYRFKDKKPYYLGTSKSRRKYPTEIMDLRNLAENNDDFTEADIKRRNEQIIDGLIDYLRANDLLVE